MEHRSASRQLSDRQVALLRLATMHATASDARAIDLVYHAADTSGIFTSSLLQRFFRDVHVATQARPGSPEEIPPGGPVIPERGATLTTQARWLRSSGTAIELVVACQPTQSLHHAVSYEQSWLHRCMAPGSRLQTPTNTAS